MISIEEVKRVIESLGITRYSDGDRRDYVTFLLSRKDYDIKYFLDLEGDFIELSAYGYGVSSCDWMLRIINKYNTSISSHYRMLKFRRMPKSCKLAIELDIPKESVSGVDIIEMFIQYSCEALDEIDELLTAIEEEMPRAEFIRCMEEAEKGLYVNDELKYECRW